MAKGMKAAFERSKADNDRGTKEGSKADRSRDKKEMPAFKKGAGKPPKRNMGRGH